MSKTEIYYKFIFPKAENLTKSNGSIPGSGQVLNLYNTYKSVGYVKTYDELPSVIKSYIDEYLKKPKYFDIRNYWDAYQSQAGGLSLIVSDSPEVNKDSKHGWTKFKSSDATNNADDTKVVYCSVIISSGNFYYNWNLPEEVLDKSGLRDKIVKSKFHQNWYLKDKDEVNEYKKAGGISRMIGTEKIVFDVSKFKPGIHYAVYGAALYYNGSNNKRYYLHESSTGTEYFSDDDGNNYNKSGTSTASNIYITVGSTNVSLTPVWEPTTYNELREDLKKDFVDLEVTRRILNNYTDTDIPNQLTGSNSIPRASTNYTGTSTVLDFSCIPEYSVRPPMPIQYDLLRSALNNRDPYGDCETVLVMWVADKDPEDISKYDNDVVSKLRELNWKQYAVPISVRCYIKNGSYSKSRFLISYPNKSTGKDDFKFHIRRNSTYNSEFKETLYLQDLIRYSTDYVITFQNTDFKKSAYFNDFVGKNKKYIFDIQHYLFTKYNNECSALYVRKQVKSINGDNKQNQNYYIYVDKNKPEHSYSVNTDNITYITNHPTEGASNRNYILDKYGDTFSPNNIIKESYYQNWNIDKDSWDIKNWFVVLFNKSQIIEEVSGVITLTDGVNLQNKLKWSITNKEGPIYNWDNIYLGTFGVLPDHSWSDADTLLYSTSESCVPLGFLDGHIKIGGSEYGREKNSKVVLGFKNMFDFTYSNKEYYHFTYNNGTYTCSYSPTVTAYVMNYS